MTEMTDSKTQTVPDGDGAGASAPGATPIDDSLNEIWENRTAPETTESEESTENKDTTPLAEETEEQLADGDLLKDDQSQQEAPEPDAPAIDAPNAWSAEMKSKWAEVPPDIRGYIAQRETEAHSEISRMGQAIAQDRPLRELLDNNMDIFDAAGVAADEGVGLLLQAQRMLQENPLQGIAAIAQTYGIDLTEAFGPQKSQSDPQIGTLQTQITQLQNQLQQRENKSRMAQAREDDIRINEVRDQLQEWGKNKPYFEQPDVRDMMGTLIRDGRAADLDTAYDMACHAITKVREEIVKKAKLDADAKARKAKEAAIKDAKRAKRSNLGSKPAGVPAQGALPNDDTYLAQVFDRVVGS